MADVIKMRRDTKANWTTANPVLANGELGFETDTKRFKMGNGSTAWNLLEYYEDGGSADKISFDNSTNGFEAINVQSAIEEVNENTKINNKKIDYVNNKFPFLKQFVEHGFVISDDDGNIGLKYDEDGFDVTHLGNNISLIIRRLSKSVNTSFAKVLEHGFYIVDSNGNIGLKYDENGLSFALAGDIPNIDGGVSKDIRILFIGNSFSADNCAYLPRLLEVNRNVDLIIGILYLSGRSISAHITDFDNDEPYTYYEYRSSNGYWTSSGGVNTTIKAALDNGVKWNVIMTHQASTISDDEESIINDVNGLPRLKYLVNGYMGYNPTWGYVMTNPKKGTEGETTFGDTMWETMCSICQHLTAQEIVDFIVPSGTAIQNARTNAELDAYGAGGHITIDGAHMEDGIGRMLGCYVLYLSLQLVFGKMKPLSDINWIPIYGDNVKNLSDSTPNTDQKKYPQTSSFDSITSTALENAKLAANNAFVRPWSKIIIS